MSKTKDGIEVKKGQVWEDLDKRMNGRRVMVMNEPTGGRVSVRSLTSNRYSELSIARMHKHSTGWKLIQDVDPMSEKNKPLLSDSLYEKLCEARRYPGQMITHAWDARLQGWIDDAMKLESKLKEKDDLIRELVSALELNNVRPDGYGNGFVKYDSLCQRDASIIYYALSKAKEHLTTPST